MKYTDPKDPLKREFEPANKVEETRFKAQGYKPAKAAEKPENKAVEEQPANKARRSRSTKSE